ncbi:hypothetical protein ACFFHM_15675 [Halalkalibacter kiskunsagensis]|uniref:Type II secretion system protein GspG C-terminal domain-containing protein n=1 Tax=Halalkalibacter kiskunsagensis TaxID=1548599 RepID=A0ABV6KG35_9BACI
MEEKRADRNNKKDIEFGAIFTLIGVFIFIVIVSFVYFSKEEETTVTTVQRIISFNGEDYEKLYAQLEEGMTIEEAKGLFNGEPDTVGDEYWEDGVKYQTFWWHGDDDSNIGCDFVDDVCDYKNGWSVEGGRKKE